MSFHENFPATPSEIAEHIDELPLWSAPFGLKLLEQLPMVAKGTILDVGAGTGFLSIEVAERFGINAKVFALDTWTEAVEKLKRKIAFRQLSNLAVLQADASSIPLPDNSVDLIICSLGINNFSDPPAVLRQCHRVAKVAAPLFIATNLVGHMAEFYSVYRNALLESNLHESLPLFEQHLAHRGTPDSIRALIAESGFRVDETVVDSFTMRFANGTALLRHTLIRIGFLDGWKSIVPDEARRTFFQLLEQRLNDYATSLGELRLTIPVGVFKCLKQE